jgi:ATPase subunit of ABC transporter with duplicated ATPase domains
MIELNIHNLTKYYGANKIFENISFDVKTGERIGLIGPNGGGKTTIFKIIMGLTDSQNGEINIRKGAKIGYLNQIPEYGETIKAAEILHMAFDGVAKIREQLNSLEDQLGYLKGEALERAVAGYGRLSEQYELAGGYEIDLRIGKVTEGLRISEEMQNMHFKALSEGEQTRVILAKILLEEPDILLLDEPTNHLDLESVEWLESFLKVYKGSVLVISHDRYFLDSIANRIVELEINHAEVYLGNYSYYVSEKERRFLLDLKIIRQC